MSRVRPISTTLLLFTIVGTASGCGDSSSTEPADDTGELVVSASPRAATGSTIRAASLAQAPVGDPASWIVGLYSFHISANANCSPPFITAFDGGGAAQRSDFMASPVLFTATGLATGTYPCVAMRISDVLEYESASTSGACTAGVTYQGDIYRAGGESAPFRDLNLAPITATGSDAVPSEDGVFILFTTDQAGAVSRGFSANQVIPLTAPLRVPDAVTFHWDATDAIVDDGGGRCLLEPGTPGLFR